MTTSAQYEGFSSIAPQFNVTFEHPLYRCTIRIFAIPQSCACTFTRMNTCAALVRRLPRFPSSCVLTITFCHASLIFSAAASDRFCRVNPASPYSCRDRTNRPTLRNSALTAQLLLVDLLAFPPAMLQQQT